jgi:hypothetical protein
MFRISFSLSLVFILFSSIAIAQTDSLYAQQWNRDPVTKLNSTTSAQRQIITAEQIRASGYNRLSDVFQLIDGWTFATMDGFSWQMQSNGVGNYTNQNWILMLNGQQTGLQRITVQDVNLLGVSVNEIERIEILNSSGIYLGEFTQKGLIHIITRKNPGGLNYRGYYSNGISTMDQGRYQTNSDAPSFVNPIGANTAHALGYRKGDFNVTASVNYQKYYAPDTIGVWRYWGVKDTLPRPINAFVNTRFETQYTGRKTIQQIQMGYTFVNEAPLDHLNTLERQTGYIGYINQWNINERHQLRFSSMLNRDGYTNYGNSWLVQFNNKISYRYLKSYKNGNLIWQTGIGYHKINRPSFTSNDLFKPYTSINIPLTRKSNLFADGMITVHDSRNAPKVSLGLYKRTSFISNWSIQGSYAEQLDLEDLSTFVMTNQSNLAWYVDNRYKSRQLTADFYYNLNIGSNVKFSYNSGIRHMMDEPVLVPYYIAAVDNTGNTLYQYASPFPQFKTTYANWINRFNIHYDIIKNLVFDFNYMRTGIVERAVPDERTVPKHKTTFVIQYELPKRFTIWTRGYYQSATKWTKFGPVETQNGAPELFYTLPSFYTMDLGLSKKLLKEYLNLNISTRNIFNSRQKYYPTGSQFNTRFTVGITANVDRLFASRTAKP